MSLVSPSLQNGLRRYIRDEWRDSDIGRNVVKTELGVVVCTVIAVAYFIILLVFSFKYDLPPMWPIFFTASALLFALSVAFMGLIAARTRDMRRLKVLTICGAIGLVYSAWKIFTTARISVFFCDDWDPWGSRDADIGSTAFVPEAIPASMVAAYLRDGDDDGGGGTAWTDDGDSGYGYATTTNRLEPYECDPTYQMLSIAVFALFVIFSIPLLMIVKVLRYKIYRAHFALDDNGTILIGRRRTRGGDEEALPAIEEVIVIVDEAEARAIEKDEECCVCYDEPRNTVFLECGHMATGINCARRVRDCPLCRAPIEKIIWRRPANAPDGSAPDASDSSNNDGDGTGTATTTTTGTSTTTQSSIGVGTSTGRRKSIKDKGKGKGKGGTGGGPGTAVGGATKARGASLSDSDLSSVSSRGRRLAGGLSFSSTESDNDGHGTAAAAAAALDADDRCSVCEAKPRDTMLMNCGHRVACVDCAADIDECPVCHQEVARRVQIFK